MYNIPPTTYSNKFHWLRDAQYKLDLHRFQMNLRAAVLDHNKKMDKFDNE